MRASVLYWVGKVAPYRAGVVFLVAAGTKLYFLPDHAPYLLRGDAAAVQYLGLLAVVVEVPLGLFLLFASRKGLISLVALGVLVVFTGYLGYVYAFTEEDCGCGGGEQWAAESRSGRFWFSLARNGLLIGGLGLHVRGAVRERTVREG